jgi:hypothetical protein
MWCRQCQQDVPIARGADSRCCPRCHRLLKQSAAKLEASVGISDCGVALETFDPTPSVATLPPRLKAESCAADLRRLERLLRPAPRCAAQSRFSNTTPGEELHVPETVGVNAHPGASADEPPLFSGLAAMLLTAGVTAFLCGVVLLATATQLAHAIAWRWGFAITTIGEGLLLAAVVALLARLWQSNRRLQQQFERIDRRLSPSLGLQARN